MSEIIFSNMLVFAVYDVKAKYYKNPFVMKTKGEALRGWADISNDEKTEIGKHPSEFCLFLIGEFDIFNGKLKALDVPESLGLAQEFKDVKN